MLLDPVRSAAVSGGPLGRVNRVEAAAPSRKAMAKLQRVPGRPTEPPPDGAGSETTADGATALSEAEAESHDLREFVDLLETDLSAAQKRVQLLEARIEQLTRSGVGVLTERRDVQARAEAVTGDLRVSERERHAALHAAQAAQDRLIELEEAVQVANDELARMRAGGLGDPDAVRARMEALNSANESLQHELIRTRQELGARIKEQTQGAAELERLRAVAQQSEQARAEFAALQAAKQERDRRIVALETELRDVLTSRDQVAEEAEDLQARLNDETAERQALEKALEEEREQRRQDQEAARARDGGDRTRLKQELADRDWQAQALDEQLAEETRRRSAAEHLDRLRIEAPGAGKVGDVLVVGGSEGAELARQLAACGVRSAAIGPAPEFPPLEGSRPVAAAMNLAVPWVGDAVRRLRGGAGAQHPPLFGYALAAGGAAGIWLGAVDFASVADEGSAVTAVQCVAPGTKRVLVISSDIGTMNRLRGELSKVHVGIAVALDLQQALDTLPAARPGAVFVDVAVRNFEVFHTLAAIRGAVPSGSLPLVFLVGAVMTPRDTAYLRAGIKLLSVGASFSPADIAAALSAAANPGAA